MTYGVETAVGTPVVVVTGRGPGRMTDNRHGAFPFDHSASKINFG